MLCNLLLDKFEIFLPRILIKYLVFNIYFYRFINLHISQYILLRINLKRWLSLAYLHFCTRQFYLPFTLVNPRLTQHLLDVINNNVTQDIYLQLQDIQSIYLFFSFKCEGILWYTLVSRYSQRESAEQNLLLDRFFPRGDKFLMVMKTIGAFSFASRLLSRKRFKI